MPPRVKIPDDDEFRALWAGDLTLGQIAGHYGALHASTVSAAAARFGLPPRGKRRSGTARLVKPGPTHEERRARQAAEAEEARVADLAARLGARGIGPEAARGLALGLVRAKRYCELEQLTACHDGITLQRLLPLWHEARA